MTLSRTLVVLSSDPDGPVVRHRWRLFETALGEAGVALDVVPWPKAKAGRRDALQRAGDAAGVVVSSRLLRRGDTKALRRRARRLAFDVDDALWLRDSVRGARPSLTRRRRFVGLSRAADLVIAGNTYVATFAMRDGKSVAVLPTVVDVPAEAAVPEPASPPLVVGWIGSRSTVPYLEQLELVLAGFVASRGAIRVRVVADAVPNFLPGIAVEHVAWSADGWRAALAGTHVGLAPLPDDPWTRGKCGLKVLQMMSVGRPVVASAVGVQESQVRHGVTGLLAANEEEFFQGLLTMADDPDLRREMGGTALEEVRRSWSVDRWAPDVVGTVERWLS